MTLSHMSEPRYDRLALLFGSLRRACFAYAVILAAMLVIIIADVAWRCVTGNMTFRDAFGEGVLILFAGAMFRSLVAFRRYTKSRPGA